MGDLKLSVRHLLAAPGFTAAATIVLALGIGLNAAMFSIVYAFTLAGRGYPAPERVVQLYARDTRPNGGYRPFSHPVYQELASQSDLFSGLLAHNVAIVGVGEGAESRRSMAALVSANYFDVLGVSLVQGRTFSPQEDRPGEDVPVVVATWTFWQRRGFDPGLVGSTLRINERPYTVIGITPRGFTGTMSVAGPELFFPLGVFHALVNDFGAEETTRSLQQADAYGLFLVGRLTDGVTLEAANARIAQIGENVARAWPAEHGDHALSLGPLPKFGTSTSPSDESAIAALGAMMMGMTLAVLLTVCLNLASLLFARGQARRKEFAVRLAVGGGRWRIIRQLLVEGFVLSALGGALGIALGLFAVDALVGSVARILPITIALQGITSPVLVAGAIAFCVFATIGFALGPALKYSRADILSDLKAQPGDEPGPRRRRLLPRNPLVAAQVAVSLTLLIAAGLFFRMALGSADTDFGFDADDTVLAEVDGQMGGLDKRQSLAMYARIEERLAALPGVQAASVGALVPMGMIDVDRDVQRAGAPPLHESNHATSESGQALDAAWNAVGARYFEAMGVSLLQGRRFTPTETFSEGAPLVAIVDEVMARKLWPDGSALGQQIQWAARAGVDTPGPPIEIVGIVSRVRDGLFEQPRGAVFVPLAQGFETNVTFHVRPAVAGANLVEAVRQEIRAAAPGVPLFGVKTFALHLETAIEYWMLQVSLLVFGLFGVLAMAVALVGIYGVTAYTVARRTREIGVRMAVGAQPAAVLGMILSESLATAASGITAGWLLGLGVGRLMAGLFVDLPRFDLGTFALIPVGFIVAIVAATWLPARRATGISPTTALRTE